MTCALVILGVCPTKPMSSATSIIFGVNFFEAGRNVPLFLSGLKSSKIAQEGIETLPSPRGFDSLSRLTSRED